MFFSITILLLFCCLIIFTPPFLIAASAVDARPGPASGFVEIDPLSDITVPQQYGKIIYRRNGVAGNHIYIVGTGHRDTLTRANGGNTAQIQAEVYRIGEWLIRHHGVELLLPEGYFVSKDRSILNKIKTRPDTALTDWIALKGRLASDNDINAEKLLIQQYGIKALQVEDETLYHEAVDILRILETGCNPIDALYKKMELDYLQERRTAAMIQKIPEIIDAQISKGYIHNSSAILTIGVSHLYDIIAWLKQNKMTIPSPAFSASEDYISEVDLITKGFDVTIIVPNAIAEDGDIITMAKLAGFVGPSAKTVVLKTGSE